MGERDKWQTGDPADTERQQAGVMSRTAETLEAQMYRTYRIYEKEL